MEQSFTYHEPIAQYQKHVPDPAVWAQAREKFKAKDYKGAIAATIQYINPKYANQGFSAGQDTYVFRHGSVKIYLKCEGDRYSVRVPFLRLPDPAPVALLRQVNEINFVELTLPSMRLVDGILEIYFEDALELADPYKMYDLLRQVSQVPDFYDDVFVEKFKASRLEKVETIPLSADQLSKAHQLLQEICTEGENICSFLESKRCVGLLLDLFYISFFKINYVLQPQGLLRSEVFRSLSELRNDEPREALVKRAKKNLEKMKMLTKEKLAESLYVPELFMSDLNLLKSDQVAGVMDRYLKMAEADRNNNSSMAASFILLCGLYNFFHYYKGPEPVEALFKSALMQASQKTWAEASDLLYQNLKMSMGMAENMQLAEGMMTQVQAQMGNIMKNVLNVGQK